MRMSRKGVLGMPIKLTGSFLIIALMVPPVMAMVDDIREDMAVQQMSSAGEKLREALTKVYSKNPSYTIHMEMSVPDGGRMDVGGDEPTIIRLFLDGERSGIIILGAPVKDALSIYGDVILEVRNDGDGLAVKEL